MIEILKRDTTTITVANFWENHQLNKYNFDPVFQRKSVWTEEKQSFFIDSIMRNFPIPPIFLHQKIYAETGQTTYDVIDGRQRLEAIIRFIRNEIPVTGDGETVFSGKYFQDLDAKELQPLKMQFWGYRLPVEYIDTPSAKVVDNIFDRLNRNGEPLEGQELRNASYHSTPLLQTVQKLATNNFWRPHLNKLSVTRMEDLEFVSEMVFVLLEGGPLEADQQLIDAMYEKYKSPEFNSDAVSKHFDEVTNFVAGLGIDIEGLKLSGPSHLYGLWTFGAAGAALGLDPKKLGPALVDLFTRLRSEKNTRDDVVEAYRKSMTYNTRSKAQRVRRLDALLMKAGLK